MARKKKRKSSRRKRSRSRKRSFLYRFFRGIFAVVLISGSMVAMFMLISQLSSMMSKQASSEIISLEESSGPEGPQRVLGDSREAVVQIGLIADVESDMDNFDRALVRLEDLGVSTVFFLGDLTTWGSVEDLELIRRKIIGSSLDFYVIPGDHDLAASVQDGDITGRTNFTSIFGSNKHVYTQSGYKFVLFDNSPNYSKLSEEDVTWFSREVVDADFVLLSQPLYHPTNNRVMGVIDGEEVSTVRNQALELLELIRKNDVQAIIAADQHSFSKNKDAEKSSLEHVVIGALVGNTLSLRNPQAPRFALIKIFDDGSYAVEDVVL